MHAGAPKRSASKPEQQPHMLRQTVLLQLEEAPTQRGLQSCYKRRAHVKQQDSPMHRLP